METHDEAPPYVIAEISGNHGGQLDKALELIAVASAAGADAVKFQHYRPDTITVDSHLPEFQIAEGQWKGETLWDLYSRAATPWEWTRELVNACARHGIQWLSSPFDESAVDFLEEFSPLAYKIASFEIIDLPLIRHAASTGRPLIVSTGMASAEEISSAVRAARDAGCDKLTLLKTNSGYPAMLEEMNLLAIPTMREEWKVEVGLSDHSPGTTAAVVAVALGATVIEKHIMLEADETAVDGSFSATPRDFKDYVQAVRDAAAVRGIPTLGPTRGEMAQLTLRPSLRAIRPIRPGETISETNVKSLRPAGGLPPDMLGSIGGWVSTEPIELGQAISWENIQPAEESHS